MSDTWGPYQSRPLSADDEIKRLQNALEEARAGRDFWDRRARKLEADLEKAEIQIERLRAERDAYKGTLRHLAGEGVTAARRALEEK